MRIIIRIRQAINNDSYRIGMSVALLTACIAGAAAYEMTCWWYLPDCIQKEDFLEIGKFESSCYYGLHGSYVSKTCNQEM